MPATEELKLKLGSHQELRSIVKTMKALSAASIRQYEHASRALSDYDRTIELGLHAVLTGTDLPNVPVRSSKSGMVVVVVIGSDHGLCGKVNEDVVNLACEHLAMFGRRPKRAEPAMFGRRPKREEPAMFARGPKRAEPAMFARGPKRAGPVELKMRSPEIRTVAVGARVMPLLESAGWPVRTLIDAPSSAARIKSVVQEILLTVDSWRTRSGLASLTVVYAHHHGATAYRPVHRSLFPVDPARFLERRAQPWPGRSRPTYSMPAERLLSSLVQQLLFVSLFRACAESQASEHGSRLAAMTAAERNLDDRIDQVATEFRRARQGAITAELLDVIAGYEALNDPSPNP